MKTTLLHTLSLLFLAATILPCMAQEIPEKEVVVIDLFARNRIVPPPYVEYLRGIVLQSFAERGRHTIFDAESSRDLTTNIPGPAFLDPATAAADQAAFLEARMLQMAAMGARYAVTGALADYKFEHVMLPAASSKQPPRPGFKSTFRVILSACDLKLGQILPNEEFTLTATAPAAEAADRMALDRIRSSLIFYIDRYFKFETSVLELCPPDKKGRIRELYIHSGTQMGVHSGDLFLVYEEVPIGGVMTRQKVGKLRVNDVENPTVAKCKITKGEEEIARAFLAGYGLVCVSDSQALF